MYCLYLNKMKHYDCNDSLTKMNSNNDHFIIGSRLINVKIYLTQLEIDK